MPQQISLLSWNVNGLRAIHRKSFFGKILRKKYDIICFQEIKVTDASILPLALREVPGYQVYWQCSKKKKGYGGVAVYTRIKPDFVKVDFQEILFSEEGRVLETRFSDWTLLNVYFPNGKASNERLRYKMRFYKKFLSYLKQKKRKKEKIIFCGDVNTAHKEIDLARPKANKGISGFLPQERAWIDSVIDIGFVDAFRLFNKNPDQYTWWDMKSHARDRNVGWRIDYFFADKKLKSNIKSCSHLSSVMGSDHCPVLLEMEI